MIVLVAIFFTVITTFLALNFTRSEKALYHSIKHLYGVEDPQFNRSMGYLLRPPLLEGNSISPLVNGIEIFPAMLADIQAAKYSICLETYIYHSGKIASKFAQALIERARNGVEVHLIIDWFGAYRISKNLQMLRDAGVHVQIFHPPRWHTISSLNNRSHRKLMIIDGHIGYIGGVGISDSWQGDANEPDEWRDTHFRVLGPVVGHLQSAFVDSWIKTSSKVLHGDKYFPALQSEGKISAQGFSSSASGGSDSAHLMFLFTIAAAKKQILISSAYFVPDRLAINEILAARKRGVKVEILVPGKYTDAKPVQHASRATWGKLLKAGVRIFQYEPTMFHVKLLIVDDHWCSVGSMNFDYRSFHLNFEANLNFFDQQVAEQLVRQFQIDCQQSSEVTYNIWRRRPLTQKIVDNFWSLLRTQF